MIFRLYPVLIIVLLGSSQIFAQNGTNTGDFEESSSNIQVLDTPNSGANSQPVNGTGLPQATAENPSNNEVPAGNSEVNQPINEAESPLAPSVDSQPNNPAPADAVKVPAIENQETVLEPQPTPASKPSSTSTTQKPSSSTTSQAPKSSSSTSTTPKPSSSSTPSSVYPFPPFPKNIGSWSVNYPSTDSSCILIKGAIQVNYMDGPAVQKFPQSIDVPGNAKASGICEEDNNSTQLVTLTWLQSDPSKSDWTCTLELTFTTDPKDAEKYSVSHIAFSFSNDDVTSNGLTQEIGMVSINGSYFSSHYNKSFSCMSQQTIKDNNELRLSTAEFQVQAFREMEAEKNKFDEAEVCSADGFFSGTTLGVAIAVILVLLIVAISAIYCAVRKGYLTGCACCRRHDGYQPFAE